MRKINTFWNWFQDNNQTIKNLFNENQKTQKQISFWLSRQLSFYCKELDFILIIPKKENQKNELIITANGKPEYFIQVIQLINNAPALKHWKFTAFIKPTKIIDEIINRLDETYILKEITIKKNEIKFLPITYEKGSKILDVHVYLKNYNIHCNTKKWHQVIYIILQESLKEKALSQNINFVKLAKMPNQAEEPIELYEMQFYIDEVNKT